MTAILGISAYYHDSAAALIVDGTIVAAAQEERFTRKKHDHEFPRNAVKACLESAGIKPDELDWVGFYEKPLTKFERLLETYLAYAPSGFVSFAKAAPLWTRTKLFLPKLMRDELGGAYRKRFVFAEHHESHAASAFFPSPFDQAAILTIDGVGEWATASFGIGTGNRIELRRQLRFPHSLGLLYSAVTYYTGFRVNSGEYKVMGLAPYGEPKYVDLFYKHLIDLKEDGSFRMDMSYFQYCQGLTMTSPKFHRLFGGPPRRPETNLTERDLDMAASVQVVTEEIMLRMARHVYHQTGMNKLCLAGGVALNCVGNGRILREGPFEDVWIQPAAGDAGGALGVALLIDHQLLDRPRDRSQSSGDRQAGSFLGTAYNDRAIERFLKDVGANYTRYDDDGALCSAVARALAEGKIVGWFQGRMEFGPRALGARSILGDPRGLDMGTIMNVKIKFRESFRPFAPAVLRDRAREYFELSPNHESPYMLLTAPVVEDKRIAVNGEAARVRGLDQRKIARSVIPSVTHVDHSARIQTVDDDRNPLFARLIREFDRLTGRPVLINTSFNVRGEPIVESPADAYRCFLATDIDTLALGRFVLEKQGQKAMSRREVERHLAKFQLD